MNKNNTKKDFFEKSIYKELYGEKSLSTSVETQIEFSDFFLGEYMNLNQRLDTRTIGNDYYEASEYIFKFLFRIEEEYEMSDEVKNTVFLHAFIIGLSYEKLAFSEDEDIVEYCNKLFFVISDEPIYTTLLQLLKKKHLKGKLIALVNKKEFKDSIPKEFETIHKDFKNKNLSIENQN